MLSSDQRGRATQPNLQGLPSAGWLALRLPGRETMLLCRCEAKAQWPSQALRPHLGHGLLAAAAAHAHAVHDVALHRTAARQGHISMAAAVARTARPFSGAIQ